MLASLAMVDLVMVFDADTPEALIKQLRPDVLIKGADCARVMERESAAACAGWNAV